MCPRGDDPLTVDQVSREIQIVVSSSSSTALSGTLRIGFIGQVISYPLVSATTATCVSSFLESKMIAAVNCTVDASVAYRQTIRVTFASWATYPINNNLFPFDGNPAVTDFRCDTTSAGADVTCSFSDVHAENLKGWWPQNFVKKSQIMNS